MSPARTSKVGSFSQRTPEFLWAVWDEQRSRGEGGRHWKTRFWEARKANFSTSSNSSLLLWVGKGVSSWLDSLLPQGLCSSLCSQPSGVSAEFTPLPSPPPSPSSQGGLSGPQVLYHMYCIFSQHLPLSFTCLVLLQILHLLELLFD